MRNAHEQNLAALHHLEGETAMTLTTYRALRSIAFGNILGVFLSAIWVFTW